MTLNIRSIAAIGAGDTNTGKPPKQSSNRNLAKSREIMTGFLERKKKDHTGWGGRGDGLQFDCGVFN
jgi:hypothetical protein